MKNTWSRTLRALACGMLFTVVALIPLLFKIGQTPDGLTTDLGVKLLYLSAGCALISMSCYIRALYLITRIKTGGEDQ